VLPLDPEPEPVVPARQIKPAAGVSPRSAGNLHHELLRMQAVENVGGDGFFETHQKQLAKAKPAPLPGIGALSHTSRIQRKATQARIGENRRMLESKLVHGELISHNTWETPQPPVMGRLKRGKPMSRPVQGAPRFTGARTTR
jgi:hypothetical protein